MKRSIQGSVAALGLLAMTAASLDAQQPPAPVTVEVRGGYTFPVGTFSSDVGAQSDFGYGAALILGLSPWFGLYGGWGRDAFHCEGCGPGDEIRASGFELGGKFTAPDRIHGARPWVKAGLLAPRSLIRRGTERFDSDRHLGFQAAVGFDAPLGEMISVSPSLRFSSFRSEFDGIEGAFPRFDRRTDFRYLSFDVSAQIHLR